MFELQKLKKSEHLLENFLKKADNIWTLRVAVKRQF